MTAGNGRWSAGSFAQWKQVAQWVISYGCAAFLFIFGALHAQQLGVVILGAMFAAGGALLGVPVILRTTRNGNGTNGHG